MKEKIRTNIRRHNRLCARLLVIAMSLFIGLSFLCEERVTVSADVTYELKDGTLTISGTGDMSNFGFEDMAPWYNFKSQIQTVIIGSGVTSIGINAFYEYKSLTSVTISDSVTSIGSSAFFGCSGLTSVTIPDGVTSVGAGAFANCSSLTSIIIPDGLTITIIPGTASQIKYKVNDGTVSITSITPGTNQSTVEIPETISGHTVVSVGDNAFKDCSGLTSVTIPDTVTSIGASAFSGCSSLTSIEIPDGVTSIGAAAFSGCSGLTSVTIPDGVTSIGAAAFSGCSGLTSVTIPDSVTSIGASAFSGCSGLTSVTIPDGVKSIGTLAFENTNIGTIYIPSEAELDTPVFSDVTLQIKYEVGADDRVSITAITPANDQSTVTIPETINGHTVVSVGDNAFKDCSGLTSVTIPDTVTSIGASAFAGCSGLTSVTIPDSVTSIGDSAFANCSGLTSVIIPDSVTSIGDSAFAGCSGLTSVTIPDGIEISDSVIPNTAFQIKYEVNEDGTVNITEIVPALSSDGQSTVAIPETIGGYTVVSVESDYQQYVNNNEHTHYTAGTATCTEGVACTICGEIVSPALGHAYGEPEFKWAYDYSTCTAEFTCTHDNRYTETYECAVSSKITIAATCEEDGEREYTASVTFGGETYSDTKTEVIEKLGHEYDYHNPTFIWANDNSTCKLVFTCTHDNSHTETYECTVSSKITIAATANTEGERTYTATAQVDGVTYTATKKEAVAKLPAAGSSSGEQNSANGGSTNSSSVNSGSSGEQNSANGGSTNSSSVNSGSSGEQNSANSGSTNSSSVNSGSSEWATIENLYTDADNRSMRRLVNGSLEIVGDSGVLAQGTKIKAMLLSSGDEFERAGQAVSSRLSGVSAYKVYDISMMTSAGLKIHELSGYVSVTLPVPEGLTVGDGKSVMVYRLEEDGTLTRCDTAIAEGKITFLTNHFSTYVFAEYSVALGAPETSDSNAGVMFMALFLLGCVVVAYVFSKKRKFF